LISILPGPSPALPFSSLFFINITSHDPEHVIIPCIIRLPLIACEVVRKISWRHAQGGKCVNKPTSKNKEIKTKPGHLLNDHRSIIHTAREYVAQTVNSSLVIL
jgi:hypothetical protein